MRFTLSMKKLTCYRNARINAFSLPELLVVLVLLCQSPQTRAQDVHDFIEGYKSAYKEYLKKARLDTSLTYVPSVVNLNYINNDLSLYQLPLQERPQKLWSYICNPILANDFAFDVEKGKYFFFPYGWLWSNHKFRKRVNKMVEAELWTGDVWRKRLLKYLQNNHIDYVFTIQNLSINFDNRFWVIYGGQLYVLQYDEGIDELYHVNAEGFMNDNIDFLKNPINEN